ncbi:hypothetical protein ANO14919_065120 [Xylariales sp. No.14919]|nr:hypothetical protein ANO14919_065120 [Xylariales sp. No.14919]
MNAPSVNAHRVRMSTNFGLVYEQCGEFRKAEQLLAEVVTSLILSLGVGDSRTRTAPAALAAMYWKQGKLSEALDLQRNIITCEEYLGRTGPGTTQA